MMKTKVQLNLDNVKNLGKCFQKTDNTTETEEIRFMWYDKDLKAVEQHGKILAISDDGQALKVAGIDQRVYIISKSWIIEFGTEDEV